MHHTQRGRMVIPVYGLTETTVCNFGSRYPGDGSQPSLGRAFSYVAVEIWDDQGQAVPPGTPGQIVLAGPLARGYTDAAQTAERFLWRNGVRWCLTGDYGLQQPDGTYRFLGRQDAQHKVAGYLVNLAAVEATLRDHPAIRDAKAFLYGGRWVIAYVVLAEREPLRMRELRTYLTSRLPNRALPACCLVLDVLPLSGSGKALTSIGFWELRAKRLVFCVAPLCTDACVPAAWLSAASWLDWHPACRASAVLATAPRRWLPKASPRLAPARPTAPVARVADSSGGE